MVPFDPCLIIEPHEALKKPIQLGKKGLLLFKFRWYKDGGLP